MEIPREVPVMTLPHTTLFPQALLPLYIFEARYRKMLQDVLDTHRMFCVAMQQPTESRELPTSVGGLGLVRASVRNRDGTSNLFLMGLGRVELLERVRLRPYRIHRIRPIQPPIPHGTSVSALCARVIELVSERLDQGFVFPVNMLKQIIQGHPVAEDENIEDMLSSFAVKQGINYLTQLNDPGQLADLVSSTLLPGATERQTILETVNLEERLKSLIHFLLREVRRNKKK